MEKWEHSAISTLTSKFIHDWKEDTFLPGPQLPWSLLGCRQEIGLGWGRYVDPKTVSQSKLRRGQGKRVTLRECVLSRDDPAQNMFSVILTGIFPIGESWQCSLGKQKTVWFISTSGFTSEHMHTHGVGGRGEREKDFVFLWSFTYPSPFLLSFPPSYL